MTIISCLFSLGMFLDIIKPPSITITWLDPISFSSPVLDRTAIVRSFLQVPWLRLQKQRRAHTLHTTRLGSSRWQSVGTGAEEPSQPLQETWVDDIFVDVRYSLFRWFIIGPHLQVVPSISEDEDSDSVGLGKHTAWCYNLALILYCNEQVAMFYPVLPFCPCLRALIDLHPNPLNRSYEEHHETIERNEDRTFCICFLYASMKYLIQVCSIHIRAKPQIKRSSLMVVFVASFCVYCTPNRYSSKKEVQHCPTLSWISSAGIHHVIYPTYTPHIPNISPIYPQYIPNISPTFRHIPVCPPSGDCHDGNAIAQLLSLWKNRVQMGDPNGSKNVAA